MRSSTRTATCACKQLSIRCEGEPVVVSLCQRRTGSVFGVAAFFPRDKVTIDGVACTYRRSSDNGFDVTFHFCGTCGSTVFWEPKRKPESIAVAVGCFADPHFPRPSKSAFDEHRHEWFSLVP
jgi:hypothetical protein